MCHLHELLNQYSLDDTDDWCLKFISNPINPFIMKYNDVKTEVIHELIILR